MLYTYNGCVSICEEASKFRRQVLYLLPILHVYEMLFLGAEFMEFTEEHSLCSRLVLYLNMFRFIL